MKSIKVKTDNIHCIDSKLFESEDVKLTAVTYCKKSPIVFLLTNTGVLLCFNSKLSSFRFSCGMRFDATDSDWFNVSYNLSSGLASTLSHSGAISQVKYDLNKDNNYNTATTVRTVVGGIATACWSPDQSLLVVVTNNHTLLLFTSSFNILREVPMSPRSSQSPCSISWRGDSELFALVSEDYADTDKANRLRIYNRSMEITAMGRGARDADASLLKGIGHVVTFTGTGAHVAVSQQRVKHKHQVSVCFVLEFTRYEPILMLSISILVQGGDAGFGRIFNRFIRYSGTFGITPLLFVNASDFSLSSRHRPCPQDSTSGM